jgi:hypothetical protein
MEGNCGSMQEFIGSATAAIDPKRSQARHRWLVLSSHVKAKKGKGKTNTMNAPELMSFENR